MKAEGDALRALDDVVFFHGMASMTAEEQVALLFEKLQLFIHRYLIVLLVDRSEAEELTQETFLRLHGQLQRGESIHNVKAWLFRVAHNLAMDREKGGTRTATVGRESWDLLAGSQLDPALDPEAVVLRDERLRLLHEAINGLPALQKHCLHLRAEGLRYREIAEILGVSESAVSESLRRGISRLVKEIQR